MQASAGQPIDLAQIRHASAITNTVASITAATATVESMLQPPVPFLFVALADSYAQLPGATSPPQAYVHVDHMVPCGLPFMACTVRLIQTLAGKAVKCDEDLQCHLSALTSIPCPALMVLQRY